jgi:dienelactone hydrolase
MHLSVPQDSCAGYTKPLLPVCSRAVPPALTGPRFEGFRGWRHLACHLLAMLLYGLIAGCAAPDFGDTEAGLALEDLSGLKATSRLAAQVPEPVRTTVDFTTAGERRVADLYRPKGQVRAGIVLVPGVAARGWRDERVVAVATTLARLDFAVLVPDMPGVRSYRMRTQDVREVADAFVWLADRPALAPRGHAGIAGFSYGVGPVLLAALEPDIRERVRFVLGVGGYYSLEHVVTFLTTGYYAGADAPDTGRVLPHPYGLATFIRSNLDMLERAEDREFFRRCADDVATGRFDRNARLPEGLGPDGRAFHALLVNRLPARVPGLLAALPRHVRAELEGIDPAAHALAAMRADVILLHGRGDNLIPYTESIALAAALPAGRSRLFLIDGLAHVDFRPKARDIPQLLGAMEALLAQRAPQREPEA